MARAKRNDWCGHSVGTLYAVPGRLTARCDTCGHETALYEGLRGWWWWLAGGWLMPAFWRCNQEERNG